MRTSCHAFDSFPGLPRPCDTRTIRQTRNRKVTIGPAKRAQRARLVKIPLNQVTLFQCTLLSNQTTVSSNQSTLSHCHLSSSLKRGEFNMSIGRVVAFLCKGTGVDCLQLPPLGVKLQTQPCLLMVGEPSHWAVDFPRDSGSMVLPPGLG